MQTCYEILPFGSVEAEAAAAPPSVLTVTCSPRHGIDHTVDFGTALAERGHVVVVHLAARAIRSSAHLDRVLGRLEAAGIDDVFVVGGDGEPSGPFASAVELVPRVAEHRHRPARIGIGAYPEGHPLIDAATLEAALREKAAAADYMTTQLCFDARPLRQWIVSTRRSGITLPIHIGIPGLVDPVRLLEISTRVGVGGSIRFLRRQHGLRRLVGRPGHAADRLDDAVTSLAAEPQLGIAGRHLYTFNKLLATVEWDTARHPSDQLARPTIDDARRSVTQ